MQEVRAREISIFGALLSRRDADIQSGDVIGVLSGKKKARYRVLWIRYDGRGDKMLRGSPIGVGPMPVAGLAGRVGIGVLARVRPIRSP